MNRITFLCVFCSIHYALLCFCASASAAELDDADIISDITPQCLLRASHSFNVPLALLLAVMDVEGGRVGNIEWNKNNTYDMGPMQVNSCHLQELKKFGITKEDIINNGCINLYAASWIIREHFYRTNNVIEAIGRYHSKTPYFKERYLRKIALAYRNLKQAPAPVINRILNKANTR